MREILGRTGDYGCPAADASVPGRPPRHARALYLCSPAALGTVLRASDSLGPLAARVEVRDLPPGAARSRPSRLCEAIARTASRALLPVSPLSAFR